VVRPVRRPKAAENSARIRRLIRQIRKHRPKTEILPRADSPCCTPLGPDRCDRLGLRHVFGLAQNSRRSGNSRPAGNRQPPEASSAARCAQFRAKTAPLQDLVLRSPALVRAAPCRSTRSDRLCLPLVKSAATIVEKKTRILVTLPASCPRQGLQHMLFDAPAPP